MTSNNDDPEDWRKTIGNSAHKAELAKRFKNNADPFKIAIVVDMWLTGFDDAVAYHDVCLQAHGGAQPHAGHRAR